jgi:hypothetical protein
MKSTANPADSRTPLLTLFVNHGYHHWRAKAENVLPFGFCRRSSLSWSWKLSSDHLFHDDDVWFHQKCLDSSTETIKEWERVGLTGWTASSVQVLAFCSDFG